MRYLLLMLSLAALLMTGCIRQELSITVAADGSGSLTQLLTISDAFSETTDESPAGIFDDGIFDDGDVPPGITMEEVSEDGFSGFRVSVPFGSPSELLALVGSLTDTGQGPSTDFVLEETDSGWYVNLLFGPFEDPAAAAAPPSGEAAALLEAILADAWFRVRLDLPGDLVEHNADRIEDGTLVWDLELTSAEPQRLFARTVGGQRVGPAETGSAGPGTEPGDGLQALVGPLGRGLSFTAVALASLLTLFACRRRAGGVR